MQLHHKYSADCDHIKALNASLEQPDDTHELENITTIQITDTHELENITNTQISNNKQSKIVRWFMKCIACQDDDKNICSICMENNTNILIEPCGHICTCEQCINMILQSKNKKCPVCRVDITNTVKAYLS